MMMSAKISSASDSLEKVEKVVKPPQRPTVRSNRVVSLHEKRAPAAPKKRTSPMQFAREVRAEARKITWTTRKETWITSVMVFIMVVVTAGFFFVVDAGLSFGVNQLLKLANAG